MEVRIRGQMTIADIRQTLFEQLHELETKYAVQFSRGATLYINPTNVFGEDVTPRMPGGHELRTLYSMATSCTGSSGNRRRNCFGSGSARTARRSYAPAPMASLCSP